MSVLHPFDVLVVFTILVGALPSRLKFLACLLGSFSLRSFTASSRFFTVTTTWRALAVSAAFPFPTPFAIPTPTTAFRTSFPSLLWLALSLPRRLGRLNIALNCRLHWCSVHNRLWFLDRRQAQVRVEAAPVSGGSLPSRCRRSFAHRAWRCVRFRRSRRYRFLALLHFGWNLDRQFADQIIPF